MSCSKDDDTPVDESVYFSKDLLDVKPNPTNSFIVKGDFSMKSDKGTYILEEYLDGTFKNIPEYLNNDEGDIKGIDGSTILLLVSIDKSGKVSVGSYNYNPKTNPDTGNYLFTAMNFTGNGYMKQDMTGTITSTGSNYFTITYTNKYEYYSYISKGNKTATKIDKRTFTF
ncbi:hypothetical protein AAGV33_14725 [Flavobacterium sp. FBOR7N2.3]|uniref:Uncharacterized protein n=1 Tax=Flavobacterium magnesitis TaxID=3138077 RepID=A0ABV4TQY5_9FLAO